VIGLASSLDRSFDRNGFKIPVFSYLSIRMSWELYTHIHTLYTHSTSCVGLLPISIVPSARMQPPPLRQDKHAGTWCSGGISAINSTVYQKYSLLIVQSINSTVYQ
jgi:hypothetical protein